MVQLNFDVELRELSGRIVDGFKLNEYFATLLASDIATENKNETLKIMNWAQKIYSDGKVTLDDVDKTILENISNRLKVTNIVKFAIMDVFNSAVKVEEPKKK